MKVNVKTKTRRFKFQNALGPKHLATWANEVIESIEKDELLVLDPKDKNALQIPQDENGAFVLGSGFKIPVSIKEWLAVGCQCIHFADCYKKDVVASYKHNSYDVLWPENAVDYKPEGPVAFVGEILISPMIRDEMMGTNDITAEHKFKCIVAHELVHVFDILKFLVPAFMDWQNFWECVLDEGCKCDLLHSYFDDISNFVDSYGEINELAMIEEYWPSQAKKWFDAFRGG